MSETPRMRDLRGPAPEAFAAAELPYCLYWIRHRNRPILIVDLAHVESQVATERLRAILPALQGFPEGAGLRVLLWGNETRPDAANIRLAAEMNRLLQARADRLAVAEINAVQRMAMGAVNLALAKKMIPFAKLAPALDYLAG